MPVVVVESPAKAKTIEKFLGKDYKVLASFGHVRDLPSKDGSVDIGNNFSMLWEISSDSKKHISAIGTALKNDNHLILATDPDREGEAISWHLKETLYARKSIKRDTQIERVVFNAVTKSAVLNAIHNPRALNNELIEAYLARRALDYLVGFNLSPVLWRKLPGARSAGRVQSVCVRLVVEREIEIEAFNSQEYWTINAEITPRKGDKFMAHLTHLDGEKLDKFALGDKENAERAQKKVMAQTLSVIKIETRPFSRSPYPPFMTSTLQQDASRRLGFGARETMQIAQRLYEAGHITYMRTDGIDMAPEAIHATRAIIKTKFGEQYIPEKPRYYKNKAKNAQEAHEAIRPTNLSKTPQDIALSNTAQKALYALIWQRTVASQMANAALERTGVDIGTKDAQIILRASGQVIKFDGFLKVFDTKNSPTKSDKDQKERETDDQSRLPQLNEGDVFDKTTITPEQHFTHPPPRYSEASLIKRMEELGIGRPSTYASIVTTIQDRGYVQKVQNRLIPEDKGRLVTVFLKNYFSKYVGYDFTASLEEELDDVSNGKLEYQDVLRRFWTEFSAAISEISELRISDVLEAINNILGTYLFPPREDGKDGRLCVLCNDGTLSVKTARAGGAFIGCSRYPDCRYTRPFGPPSTEDAAEIITDDKVLGHDEQNTPILLRKGRFGFYVQREAVEAVNENTPKQKASKKPKRASIPKGWNASEINLEKALLLLSLPRQIGAHPEDNDIIISSIGPYGPYIKHGKIYANIDNIDDVFTITVERAVAVIAEKKNNPARARAQAKTLVSLGEHPEKGGAITIRDGRYGPYVKWEKINAPLPRDKNPTTCVLAEAIALLEAKIEKGTKRKRKHPTSRKKAKK